MGKHYVLIKETHGLLNDDYTFDLGHPLYKKGIPFKGFVAHREDIICTESYPGVIYCLEDDEYFYNSSIDGLYKLIVDKEKTTKKIITRFAVNLGDIESGKVLETSEFIFDNLYTVHSLEDDSTYVFNAEFLKKL